MAESLSKRPGYVVNSGTEFKGDLTRHFGAYFVWAAASLLLLTAFIFAGAYISHERNAWVTHTIEVLRYADALESSLQMASLPAEEGSALDRDRIQNNLEQVRVSLSKLGELTRDNPIQSANCLKMQEWLTELIDRQKARESAPPMLRTPHVESLTPSIVATTLKEFRAVEQKLLDERQSRQRAADLRFWPFAAAVLAWNIAMLLWAFRAIRRWTAEKESREADIRQLNQRLANRANDTLKINVSLEQRVHDKTAELERTIAQLKSSNVELERLTYVVAHDLQEPLRQMVSFGNLLSSKYPDRLDETAQRYLSYSVEGAKRLQTMLNGLLHYTTVCPATVQPVSFLADDLVASVLGELAWEAKSVTVEVRGVYGFTAFADPSLLRIVLLAFLSNAFKFRRPDVSPKVVVAVEVQETAWAVSVTDNGIGIEERFSSMIFQMFARLHPVGRYPGVGVGLALSKRIAECHGGTVAVSPNPEGVGSRFTVSLPLKGDSNDSRSERADD